MEPLTVAIAGAAAYGIWRKYSGRKAIDAPKELKKAYQAALEWPESLALHHEWGNYGGARPEVRGAPANTILAVRGIEKLTPEARAAMLDVAERVNVPVDSLAVIIAKESGFNPAAAYLVDEVDENKKPTGRRVPFATGLIQITRQAHLPGFSSIRDLERVRQWPAEKQLAEVVAPYFERFKSIDPLKMSPGHVYMLNFLPDDAAKPDGFVLGVRQEDEKAKKPKSWREKVYAMNAHFDAPKRGHFTVGDVKNAAGNIARGAGGRRITVDGKIVHRDAPPKRNASKTQPSGAPLKPVYDESENAGGILLAAVKAGKYVEPTWVPVKLRDLVVMVTADAIQGKIAVRFKAEPLPPDVLAALKQNVKPEEYDAALKELQTDRVSAYDARLPVSYEEQVEIARHFGAVSPTKEIWDASFEQAVFKLQTKNWPGIVKGPGGLPDGTIKQSGTWDSLVGNVKTALTRDVGKGWILDRRITEKGAVNYGLIDPATKKPTQTVGGLHGPQHFDYSQTCVLVKRFATRGGQKIDLLDELEKQGIPRRYLDVYR